MKMLSISKKIFSGFTIILILWICLVAHTTYTMHKLRTYTQIYDNSYSKALIKVSDLISSVRRQIAITIEQNLRSRKNNNEALNKEYKNFLLDTDITMNELSTALHEPLFLTSKNNYLPRIEGDKQELKEVLDTFFSRSSTSLLDLEESALLNKKLHDCEEKIISDLENFKNELGTFPQRITREINGIFDVSGYVLKLIPLAIFIYVVIFSMFISNKIAVPIEKLEKAMSEAEKGKLSVRLKIDSRDEFQRVADNFNKMLEGICAMIARVLATSDNLATSSQELSSASVESAATLLDISKNVNGINQSSLEISHNLEKTSASVEVFSQSARQVADLASTAVDAVIITTEAADKGGRTVKQSVDMIGKIKESVDVATQVILDLNSASLQISEIVNTISAISSQTNLLALNAAIEAARAGEQGKGFTVVADEVRKLAEESAEAADAIATRIENILTKTQNAVDSMTLGRGRVDDGIRIIRDVSIGLDNIIRSVNDVNHKITEISSISSEQSENSQSMTRTIEDITDLMKNTTERLGIVATSVEQQTTTVSQVSSATEDLANLADELHLLVSRFTIKKVEYEK